MGAGPRRNLEGRNASPPRVGLLQSALRPDDPDSRWENGFDYEVEGCTTPNDPRDPCSTDQYVSPERPTTVAWEPYELIADYECTTLGKDLSDVRAKVLRRLNANTSFILERELWTGDLAADAGFPNLSLASQDADNLSEGGTVNLTHGLACLTQFLAENNGGQRGMIHATPQVVVHWTALNLIRREGNLLLTVARDDVVVPGSGYTGSAPGGEPAVDSSVWAYATDMVEVRLSSDVLVTGVSPDEVDRVNNTIEARAVQLGVASWDGCRHGAVELDVTTCSVGGS